MEKVWLTVETYAEINRVLRLILSEKPKQNPGTKEDYWGNEDDAHYQGKEEVRWEHGELVEEVLRLLTQD